MKRNTVFELLTLLIAASLLSACILVLPFPIVLDESGMPQLVIVEPEPEYPFEQIEDCQCLAEYEAYLAGYQVTPSNRMITTNRFEQIPDCQCLAEYQAFLAGFQVAPNP